MTSVVQARPAPWMAMGPLASCMEIWPAIWPARSAARSGVRLATRMEVAPCWMRWRAARSDILPAPTMQDGLAAQAAEDLAGEIDGDRCDGDGGAADLGLGADSLGHREGALQERFERRGDGAGLARDGVGLLDLAEDLRLADDHGVERAGDAEEMADGLALAELVEVRFEEGGGYGEVLVQEAEKVGGIAVAGVVLDGEELDAVAGGEDEGLADAGLMGECARGIGEAGGGDGEALADLDGGGGVVDADQDERSLGGARVRGIGFGGRGHDREARGGLALGRLAHGVENLCTAERFAAQTKSTATRTAPER